MIYSGLRITEKQEKIIRILHQFRGLRYDQLIPELAERMKRTEVYSKESFRKNTYKDLQVLEEMKFIKRDPMRLEKRTVDFIYLTESGLEFVCELLDIPPGYIGTGWNNDFGDFPYELHRPPKAALIHHHLMLTDVLLELKQIERNYPYLNSDSRDNRYCAKEFKWKDGETIRFRPDADLILGDKGDRFLVEVDRGTEFEEKLREKFRSYAAYLQYLKEQGERLPAGVIFVLNKDTPNKFSRRWSLVSAAFLNEMKEWAVHFNLIACNLTDLQSVLHKQESRLIDYEEFYNKMIEFRREGVVGFYPIKEGHGIEWIDNAFSHFKSETSERIYVYERCEPFETIGISRVHTWWKTALTKKWINDNTQFVTILLRTEGEPYPLSFKGSELEMEYEEAFSNHIWIRTKPYLQWYNQSGEPVNSGHPLLRFPL